MISTFFRDHWSWSTPSRGLCSASSLGWGCFSFRTARTQLQERTGVALRGSLRPGVGGVGGCGQLPESPAGPRMRTALWPSLWASVSPPAQRKCGATASLVIPVGTARIQAGLSLDSESLDLETEPIGTVFSRGTTPLCFINFLVCVLPLSNCRGTLPSPQPILCLSEPPHRLPVCGGLALPWGLREAEKLGALLGSSGSGGL